SRRLGDAYRSAARLLPSVPSSGLRSGSQPFAMKGTAMSAPGTPILLLHGLWHGTWCWSEVLARLTAAGRRALAVDMAGRGLRAGGVAARTARPFDPAALAGAPSPAADISLPEAAALLVSQAEALGSGAPVTAVAHSMGGTVLTRAVQDAPHLF